MTEQQFYQLLKRRLAQSSIGSSAIRNQGAPGLIGIMKDYLETQMDLKQFITLLPIENQYENFLDYHTLNALKLFPSYAKSWGAARKGLNLFLREIVYNKFFSELFSFPEDFQMFNSFIKYLEVPLDKEVANGLIADSLNKLPRWKSIKELTPTVSRQFQDQAMIISIQENIARVNLDIKYWRSI